MKKTNVYSGLLTPNIGQSKIFTIQANKISIPVGHEVSNDSIFETSAFAMEGEVNIVLTVSEDIHDFSIHPISKNIAATKSGNTLKFKINEPSNLMVKVNNLTPLLLFATPMETNVPDSTDANVIYFGPGVHNVGRMQLESNQTVYIASGAIVYGTFEGYEVENVTIKGRGCLDGSKHTSWEKRIFGIYFDRSKNITIEGIAIRNCYWWVTHFLLCENIHISHINLFSFYRNNGGLMLDGCENYHASNSFILTNDDCICPHALNAAGNGEPVAKNYTFENMVLYNVLSGNGIRIGASFETSKAINWVFKDIDVLAHTNGSAIISDHSDWAEVKYLWFINFNDEQAKNKTIDFFIDSTRYSCFTGYNDERGKMDGLYFVDLNTPGGDISLKGFDDEHGINNVNFYNCKIGSNSIDSKSDITTNEFVTNIHFSQESKGFSPAFENVESLEETTSPTELILDNLDSACRFIGFDYKKGTADFVNGDYHTATVPEGFSNFKAAIYEPKIAGDYEVYIHWKKMEKCASNAKWIVHHREGYSTKFMNQNELEGWQLHGNYSFDGSSYVRLSLPGYFQIADGNVVADAVKFVKIK